MLGTCAEDCPPAAFEDPLSAGFDEAGERCIAGGLNRLIYLPEKAVSHLAQVNLLFQSHPGTGS